MSGWIWFLLGVAAVIALWMIGLLVGRLLVGWLGS
jgi:hypothetical protein